MSTALQRIADSDLDCILSGWTPLHFACYGTWPQFVSNTRAVQCLLDAGADPNAAEHSGFSCLHIVTDSSAALVRSLHSLICIVLWIQISAAQSSYDRLAD